MRGAPIKNHEKFRAAREQCPRQQVARLDPSQFALARTTKQNRSMISKYASAGIQLLNHPLKVFWICAAVCFASVILDGSFIRLWSLHREASALELKLAAAEDNAKQIALKIKEAQQPAYIERQARDQLDLVKEGDLVFVFADEAQVANQY